MLPLNNRFQIDRLIDSQIQIARRVELSRCRIPLTIAGADVAVKNRRLVGAVVLFSYPELKLLETAWAGSGEKFPYIPNFLAFREMPLILRAYKKLSKKPDLILVDGQGIAHPRRCGIATHLGVVLNKPTIGCAKTHLFGDFKMPGKKKGDWELIRCDGEKIGVVLRTKENIRPVFVSPGNKVDFSDCIKYILTTARYRIPEPIRYAHMLANEIMRVVRD